MNNRTPLFDQNLHVAAMFSVLILIAACSSSNTPTNPEPPKPDAKRLASVSGVVTGSSGLDVGSIAIGLTSESSSRTVVTSVDGTWRIDSVPPGSYTATPSKAGLNFTPQSAPVAVDTVNVTGVNFTARQAVSTGNRPDLVEIPAGEFVMGTGAKLESPIFPRLRVRFTRSWFAATTETTQEQYERVMGSNPSDRVVVGGPVNGISLLDMMRYCNKLSEIEGFTPCYTLTESSFTWDRSANGYRLPTDAEWEYMARAGDTSTAYGRPELYDFRDTPDRLVSIIGDIAWFLGNCAEPPEYSNPRGPYPVGLKLPNKWGLFDVLGNVSECVYDLRVRERKDVHIDPVGAPSIAGARMLARGGGFEISPVDLINSNSLNLGARDVVWGFRIVRSIYP